MDPRKNDRKLWDFIHTLEKFAKKIAKGPKDEAAEETVFDNHRSKDRYSDNIVIGYWRMFDSKDNLPWPVANSAKEDQSDLIEKAEKLLKDQFRIVYKGLSRCRLCRKENGAGESIFRFRGNNYVIPDGYIHLLKKHNVAMDSQLKEILNNLDEVISLKPKERNFEKLIEIEGTKSLKKRKEKYVEKMMKEAEKRGKREANAFNIFVKIASSHDWVRVDRPEVELYERPSLMASRDSDDSSRSSSSQSSASSLSIELSSSSSSKSSRGKRRSSSSSGKRKFPSHYSSSSSSRSNRKKSSRGRK